MRELLTQGLIMTVLGMGLVFAGLALLWGLIALLTRVFAAKPEEKQSALQETTEAGAIVAETLTEERARVAALVAGALMANALPLLPEAPVGPAFEHGRTAPSWVTSNRTSALHAWQPPRMTEG
ncbi:MAG: hypothetical protein CVU38_06325 [Chloroflexi bacterium HGW-Chloroflexi-1]|nr:MAG: hypothetical protein CVU38_06325 [Chloroflexi bacterium HGW-Chloroflexi-1]